jgi:hypothetical protein
MGRRTGERRPVTHWPQKRDRIERSAPVLRAGSGRWTPFPGIPPFDKAGERIGVRGRTADGSLRGATGGPPSDARAVVRSFGTEQVRSPFDRSSGRLAQQGCGRAVARGKRAIGSAMRVVKVRDRRGPEREPAPTLCRGIGRGSSRREAPRSGGDRSLPGYAFRALSRSPTLTIRRPVGRVNALCVPSCVPNSIWASRGRKCH